VPSQGQGALTLFCWPGPWPLLGAPTVAAAAAALRNCLCSRTVLYEVVAGACPDVGTAGVCVAVLGECVAVARSVHGCPQTRRRCVRWWATAWAWWSRTSPPICAGLIIAFTACWQLALVVLSNVPLLVIAGAMQMKALEGFSENAKVSPTSHLGLSPTF